MMRCDPRRTKRMSSKQPYRSDKNSQTSKQETHHLIILMFLFALQMLLG